MPGPEPLFTINVSVMTLITAGVASYVLFPDFTNTFAHETVLVVQGIADPLFYLLMVLFASYAYTRFFQFRFKYSKPVSAAEDYYWTDLVTHATMWILIAYFASVRYGYTSF